MTANNSPSNEPIALVHSQWRASIAPRGASLIELWHGETQVTTSDWKGASEWFSGSTLFPWVNRLDSGRWQFDGERLQAPINDTQNNCANHGLVFDREFTLERVSDHALTLTIELSQSDSYPGSISLDVTYSLSNEGLTVHYEVTNKSTSRLAFSIGGHPYLLAVQGSILEFAAQTRVEVDARLLPTHKRKTAEGETHIEVGNRKNYTDACFTELPRDETGRCTARLTRPDTNQVISLWQDAEFSHLQVFTLQTGRSDRPNLVALEPQTAGANSLNTQDDLIWLDAHQSWNASWGIKIGEN